MTARSVTAACLPFILLSLLAACSSDAPSGADMRSPSDDADSGPRIASPGALPGAEPAGDEFAAAPPVGEREMAPLPKGSDISSGEREMPAIVPDTGPSDAKETEDDFSAAPPALERDPPDRPSAEPTENPFDSLPDPQPDEPARVAGDDDGFSAAPPVAVTDAAAPIPGLETPPRVATDPADAPYWPRFHGPHGDNKSTDTGLLQQWPDDGPPLVWTCTEIGDGYSSVSLAGGLIFTAGNKDGNTVISAIDLDGQLAWQANNGPAWTADFEGTRGTPTIDGDRLYHQSPLGNIVCLKAQTGEKIWERNSLDMFDGKNIQWALSESLLVDGDHVICCPGGSKASMAALNKMTGETVWTTKPTGDKAGYSTPTLAEFGGLRMIFVMASKAVIGVNADTGQLLFRHPFETKYDVNVLKPIFHDGRLFVSGGYATTGSQLLKLNVDGDNVSVDLVWESEDLDNQHGGVLLLDGFLYGAAHNFSNAKWVCLDWETGEMKWAERAIGKGSLTYADSLLYLMNEKSTVALARGTPDGLEVISDFRLPAGGNGASWAHPVVCGGRLYIRHADRLFAYDIRSGV